MRTARVVVAKFVEEQTVESLLDFGRNCEGHRKRAAEISVFVSE